MKRRKFFKACIAAAVSCTIPEPVIKKLIPPTGTIPAKNLDIPKKLDIKEAIDKITSNPSPPLVVSERVFAPTYEFSSTPAIDMSVFRDRRYEMIQRKLEEELWHVEYQTVKKPTFPGIYQHLEEK
jgi:hypothetical protein